MENKAASKGLPCFKNEGKQQQQNKERRITNLCLCPCLHPGVKSTHTRGASNHFSINSLWISTLPPRFLWNFLPPHWCPLADSASCLSQPLLVHPSPSLWLPPSLLLKYFDSNFFLRGSTNTYIQLCAIAFDIQLLPSLLSLCSYSQIHAHVHPSLSPWATEL